MKQAKKQDKPNQNQMWNGKIVGTVDMLRLTTYGTVDMTNRTTDMTNGTVDMTNGTADMMYGTVDMSDSAYMFDTADTMYGTEDLYDTADIGVMAFDTENIGVTNWTASMRRDNDFILGGLRNLVTQVATLLEASRKRDRQHWRKRLHLKFAGDPGLALAYLRQKRQRAWDRRPTDESGLRWLWHHVWVPVGLPEDVFSMLFANTTIRITRPRLLFTEAEREACQHRERCRQLIW